VQSVERARLAPGIIESATDTTVADPETERRLRALGYIGDD
jgi:hypothetical protein